MNDLIEHFGRYEKCKEIVNQPLVDFAMNAQALREAMLEYRREHGIFEAGDKVIDGLLGNQVIMYQDSYKFLGSGYVSHYIRHATDLEIQAGHRLP